MSLNSKYLYMNLRERNENMKYNHKKVTAQFVAMLADCVSAVLETYPTASERWRAYNTIARNLTQLIVALNKAQVTWSPDEFIDLTQQGDKEIPF